jgi:hypothetical protein
VLIELLLQLFVSDVVIVIEVNHNSILVSTRSFVALVIDDFIDFAFIDETVVESVQLRELLLYVYFHIVLYVQLSIGLVGSANFLSRATVFFSALQDKSSVQRVLQLRHNLVRSLVSSNQ